jgi:hypothetical protein
VSEFRIEKRRTEAALTLATGATIQGCFFLSGSRATHSGPERVGDLLNAEPGFFPFEIATGTEKVIAASDEVDAGEALVHPRKYNVEAVAFSPGRKCTCSCRPDGASRGGSYIYKPTGRDRLSDYARALEMFLYVETEGATIIINSAHIVELRETNQA